MNGMKRLTPHSLLLQISLAAPLRVAARASPLLNIHALHGVVLIVGGAVVVVGVAAAVVAVAYPSRPSGSVAKAARRVRVLPRQHLAADCALSGLVNGSTGSPGNVAVARWCDVDNDADERHCQNNFSTGVKFDCAEFDVEPLKSR